MTTIAFGPARNIDPTAFSRLNVAPVDREEQSTTGKQGDTVTISEAARNLAAGKEEDSQSLNMSLEQGGKSKALKDELDEEQLRIRQLREKIRKLQKEIKELEESALSEKEKATQLQTKQAELLELTSELQKLLNAGSGGTTGGASNIAGGTRAGSGTFMDKGSLT